MSLLFSSGDCIAWSFFFWPSCTPGIMLFFFSFLTLFPTPLGITWLHLSMKSIYTQSEPSSIEEANNQPQLSRSVSISKFARTVIYNATTVPRHTYFLSSPLLSKNQIRPGFTCGVYVYISTYIFQCSVLRRGSCACGSE